MFNVGTTNDYGATCLPAAVCCMVRLRTIGTIKGQTAIERLCPTISTHHDHSCLRLLVLRTVTVFSADKL